MTYTIEEISDRLEIMDMFARYVHAADEKVLEPLECIFLPETVFDWTASGGVRTTWAEAKKGDFITGKLFPYVFHICTNIQIIFDGDHQGATVKSKTIHPTGLNGVDGNPLLFQVQGVYLDRLTKTAEGWRISQRLWKDFWAVGPIPLIDGIGGMLNAAGKSNVSG
jgi:hypothetical protein